MSKWILPALMVLCLFFSGCKTTIQSVAITSGPYKTIYGQGQDLNLSGLTVIGTYSDDSSQQISIGSSNISGYNKNLVGQQTVTVRAGKGSATFTVTVKPLLSLSLPRPPSKRLYRQGDNLDLDDIVLMGVWEDMEPDRIPLARDMVSAYNLDVPGPQEIYISIGLLSVSFPVTVVPLSSMVITRPPAKQIYKQGESLDLTGLILTGTWEGIGNYQIPVTRNMVSTYNLDVPGSQEIYISVGLLSVSFPVTVVPLSSMTVTRPPTKQIYKQGESLDLTGLIVTGTWEGIGNQQLRVDRRNISGYDANIIGRQVITITRDGVSASFTVTVKGLMNIAIASSPNKVVYDQGENLDLSGLVVVGTYSDASQERIPVNASNISRYDPSRGGEQTVVITIDGKAAVFSVYVRVLNFISVQRAPNKAVYGSGEALDLSGLVVVGTYSDNSTKIIPQDRLRISGYNNAVPGQQTLTVSVDGKQAKFSVTVLPPERSETVY